MQTSINEKANSGARQIWVDADASPKVIKEILYKACERTKTNMVLVANQLLETPRSRYIRSVQVPSGFDVADNYIVENSNKSDIVITADIPLAAELVAKDCVVLNPRGERYTKENIRQTLNMRDFMDSLRSSGVQTGGPDSFSKSDRMAFANSLDRILAQGS
ncbi:MAG: YaiI/YqxD family protein [Arenicellales bacterium]|jgi:uncharacterized protein YaiI (UPF0178 family)